MLKAVVRSRRENKMGRSELLDIPEALELTTGRHLVRIFPKIVCIRDSRVNKLADKRIDLD